MDEVSTAIKVKPNQQANAIADQRRCGEGTASYRSIDHAEYEIGCGATTIRNPRGKRDRIGAHGSKQGKREDRDTDRCERRDQEDHRGS